MWSALFGKGNNILNNYELGDALTSSDSSMFTLYKSINKTNNEEVCILICNIQDLSPEYKEMAHSAVRWMKTLRHPAVLNYNDGIDCDNKIYVVTEAVLPVKTYLAKLDKSHYDNFVSCGISRILSLMMFLNDTHKLAHNNINTDCIFVNKAGDWRLGGLEFMTHVGESTQVLSKISKNLKIKQFPRQLQQKILESSIDLFCLGVALWELYSDKTLRDFSELNKFTKCPANLKQDFELFMPDSKRRCIGDVLHRLGEEGHFLNNKYITSINFLDEIIIKENHQKKLFFAGVGGDFSLFPLNVCQNKIFPAVLDFIQFDSEEASFITLFFKISQTFTSYNYSKTVIPAIITLLKLTSRSIRCKMLRMAEEYGDKLDPKVLNDELFNSICLGLYDNAPQLRECTIKAFEHFAPHLNAANFKTLLTGLAKIQQNDCEGGIRANATICVCKIACILEPNTRQKVLIRIFSRAIADTYPGTREAGILSFACTEAYYTRENIASFVMPALCYCTVDPVKQVRDHSFKTLEGFITKLKAASEDSHVAEDVDLMAKEGGQNATQMAGKWVSMAMNILSKRLIPRRVENKIVHEPQVEKEEKADIPDVESVVSEDLQDFSFFPEELPTVEESVENDTFYDMMPVKLTKPMIGLVKDDWTDWNIEIKPGIGSKWSENNAGGLLGRKSADVGEIVQSIEARWNENSEEEFLGRKGVDVGGKKVKRVGARKV